jgi:serine/threonine protein phosphatase PrpC
MSSLLMANVPPSIPQPKQMPTAMDLRQRDVIPTFEIPGFKGITVDGTLEKKLLGPSTDPNERKPNDPNEDAIIVDPESGLIGVADGAGGSKNAAQASQAVSRELPRLFKEGLENEIRTDEEAKVALQTLLEQKAGKNKVDFAVAQKKANALFAFDPSMGKKALALMESVFRTHEFVKDTGGASTVCAGFIHRTPDGSRYAVVANAGDSGAFVRRKDGRIMPLTIEDSLIQVMLSQGYLTADQVEALKRNPNQTMEISGKQRTYLKLKHAMAGGLGGDDEAATPSLSIAELMPGDELVLCTDGILDKFEDTKTGELDTLEVAKAMQGANRLDELDNLRAKASRNIADNKDTDDIAILRARVN